MNSKKNARRKATPSLFVAAAAALSLLESNAFATTYTYTYSTADTTNWSDGSAAHWNATPVSATDTALLFTGSLPFPATGTGVTVTSNNNIGTFKLNSLDLAMPGAGTGVNPTFVVSGLTLEFTGSAPVLTIEGAATRSVKYVISAPMQLDADLTINATISAGNTSSIGTANGPISGSSGLIKTGAGTFTIAGAGSFTGLTQVLAGTLSINAATGGSLFGSTGILVDTGSLQISKNATFASDVFNSTATITLQHGGSLQFVPSQGNFTESFGLLAISAGNSSFTASTTASGNPILTATSFSRVNNGTALIALKGGGVGISNSVAAHLRFTDASGFTLVGADTATTDLATNDTALRIIPYLLGASSATTLGENFVTYDANNGTTVGGIRMLQSTEQITLTNAYIAPVAHENAIASATTTLAAPTVNSLLFNSSVALNGAGTLTVDSGAIAAVASSSSSIGGFSGLTLKNGEGLIQVVTGCTLSITSTLNVTGSSGEIAANGGGLTVAGGGTLTLRGASNYTGPTNINQGSVIFATTASLYNGNTANWTAAQLRVRPSAGIGFNVGGTGEFTTGNITTLLAALATSNTINSGTNANATLIFDTTNAAGGSFTIADNIVDSTGSFGGMRNVSKIGSNTLVLSGTNTYTGTTTLTAGTLEFINKTSFYNGDSSSWSKTNVNIATGAALVLRVGGPSGEFIASDISALQTNLKTGNTAGGLMAGSTLGLDTTDGNFTNTSGISDRSGNAVAGPGAINFLKLGANTLTMSTANSYTGTTTIAGGTLAVSGTLANTASIAVNASAASNTVLSLVSSSAAGTTVNLINDLATISLSSNGSSNGLIDLSFSKSSSSSQSTYVIEKVAGLTIDGVVQPTGFYSSFTAPTGATADEAYFTGLGVIQVVPEPTSLGAVMIVGAGLLRRRRSRSRR